ncbi:MAG: hypothetical protein D6820_00685 [Lentisphaerae bacterium]|nr:MAG: hypothetical protein D6820_00685 [Lentisphaerota bacterium]
MRVGKMKFMIPIVIGLCFALASCRTSQVVENGERVEDAEHETIEKEKIMASPFCDAEQAKFSI